MKGSNVHSKKQFIKNYKDKDWESYRGLLSEVIIHALPGKWVDLGAGLGLFTECAARFGVECIGLEGSRWAVKESKKRYPKLQISQHYLEDKLPFKKQNIYTIICFQTIEHLLPKTVTLMLKECNRVLVKGGKVIVYSPCKYNKAQQTEETHINLYTPSQLRRLLRNAGFGKIKNLNSPRMVLGENFISRYIMMAVFKYFPIDYLSSTANCVATKY